MEHKVYSSYNSAPVDPDNPGFDSLLSALKAFHEGEIGKPELEKYHTGLTAQLNQSRDFISNMEVNEASIDTKNICLGSLDMVQTCLNALQELINNPSKENMGFCVQSLLDAKTAVEYVHEALDQNIKEAGITPEK